jgi:protein-tyrosine-phosphatase
MNWISDDDSGIGHVPSQDERPNSGLREGDVTHAEVNDAIKYAPKTVIFGQQTRVRLGLVMEDDSLPRFHAGHDLVKFFYGAIRQIPETILDGILVANISVTLVQKRELLFFKHVRAHQAFHTGRTRRTIYMPEHVVEAAFKAGYDYWALAEVIVKEAYPLLDYVLLVDLVRRMQTRMRQIRTLPGVMFLKDTLRACNNHLKDPSQRLREERRFEIDPKEDEFSEFYGHYGEHFKSWGRDLIERDPYDVADEVFDEPTERRWAEWKVDGITHTYRFPTFFQLDRDIVHPAAHEQAAKLGQSTEPESVDEYLHDLTDLARFRQGRQVKSEPLLDRLIDMGAPGILGFARLVASERAFGHPVVTNNYFDGWQAVQRFREKLQALSSDLPPDLGVGATFDNLVTPLVVAQARAQLERFRHLTDLEGGEWLLFLRQFVFELIGACKPYIDDAEKELMLTVPGHYGSSQTAAAWIELAGGLMPEEGGDNTDATLAQILQELRRHPDYHSRFLEQARELTQRDSLSFGDDVRGEVEALLERIPDPAYRESSEPHAVRRRVDELARLHADAPDSRDQFLLLAEIFVRLDRCHRYDEFIEQTRRFLAGDEAVAVQIRAGLAETILAIGDKDERRAAIRRTAMGLLQEERGAS